MRRPESAAFWMGSHRLLSRPVIFGRPRDLPLATWLASLGNTPSWHKHYHSRLRPVNELSTAHSRFQSHSIDTQHTLSGCHICELILSFSINERCRYNASEWCTQTHTITTQTSPIEHTIPNLVQASRYNKTRTRNENEIHLRNTLIGGARATGG